MQTTVSDPTLRKLTAAASITQATQRLRAAGIESAARDSRLLVAAALGLDAARLLSLPEMPVSEAVQKRLQLFIERRLAREPVSRILGSRGFYGREFEISPATLDPRPDSETLVEAALDLIGAEGRRNNFRIVDVGTGSGCLLVTLLAELPNAMGLGTDIDVQALQVAERNAVNHGVAPRAKWMQARSLHGIEGPFDLLVANPPYVPTGEIDGLEPEVREYDPRQALDGGVDGLAIYRELAEDLVRVVPEGWAIFEVGAGQAAAVRRMLAKISRDPDIRIFADLNGVDRCVAWRARQ